MTRETKGSRRARDRQLHAETVAKHARPPTRIERVRDRMVAGDWPGAFRAAAKLRDLSAEDQLALGRAYEASQRPAFARQIGRDPDALIAAGKAVLRRRFPDEGAT